MPNKKGSVVVLFAILGFVILVTGSFIYYLRDSSIGGSIEAEAKKRILLQNDVMAIKYYIERNVQDSFVDAVIALLQKPHSPNNCILDIPAEHNGLRCGIVQGNYSSQPDPYLEEDIPEPASYTYGSYALFEGGIPFVEIWLSIYMEDNFEIDFSDFEKIGYKITELKKPEFNVRLNKDDVSIELIYPLKIEKASTVSRLEYFKFIYDYDLYKFLIFIFNMINGTTPYKTETLNLFYNPIAATEYLVERIAGVTESYDVIKVTDENMLLDGSFEGFSFSFIRENRPPDANTLFFTNLTGDIVSSEYPLLYGNDIYLHCPNAQNSEDFADPDEDDMYGYLTYSYDGWLESSSCGNSDAMVNYPTDSCDVCNYLTVTLTDPGGFQDVKIFDKFITCNSLTGDKNNCCGSDGCWDIHQPHGCGYDNCPWVADGWCTYTYCAGGCDGPTATAEAVTHEYQYQDWCDECGNCVCSNSLNQRERSYDCPPSTTCSPCPSGGGESEPSCFLKDSLILATSNTFKRIQDIELGDRVISYDFEDNKLVSSRVIKKYKAESDSYYLINNELKVTSKHPFAVLVNNNFLWKNVEDLKIGDKVRSIDGFVKINSIKEIQEKTVVYNMHVSAGNYFVSDGMNMYLVHNKAGDQII